MISYSRAAVLAALIVSMAMADVWKPKHKREGLVSETPMPINSTVATNLTTTIGNVTVSNVTMTPALENQTLSTLAPRPKRQLTEATGSPAPFNQTLASNFTTIGNVSTTLSNVTISNVTLTPTIMNQTLSTLAPRPKRQLPSVTASPTPSSPTVAPNPPVANVSMVTPGATPISNMTTPSLNVSTVIPKLDPSTIGNTSIPTIATTPAIQKPTLSTPKPAKAAFVVRRRKRQLINATESPAPFNQTVASNMTTIDGAPTTLSNVTIPNITTTSVIGNETASTPNTRASGVRDLPFDSSIGNTSNVETTPTIQKSTLSESLPLNTTVLANLTTIPATDLEGSKFESTPSINASTTSSKFESTTASSANASVFNATVFNLATTTAIQNDTFPMLPEIGHLREYIGDRRKRQVEEPKRQVSSDIFNCADREPGLYGNPKEPCDNKYYSCVSSDSLADELPCPTHLFFDEEKKSCESWSHIPACSGKSRATEAPIEVPGSKPMITTVAPVVDCTEKPNGNYPDPVGSIKPGCSNIFYACTEGRTEVMRCPEHLIFDQPSNSCLRRGLIFACTGERVTEALTTRPPPATLPPVPFDCTGRPNGDYAVNCSNTFYSCSNGKAREMHCSEGLVFEEETQACDIPSNTFICTGTRKTTRLTTTTEPVKVITTPSPMDCVGKPDGLYPNPLDKCSHIFYYCSNNGSVYRECSGNLFYDIETKQCDLWLNVFACSGIERPTPAPTTAPATPPIRPAVDFDCSRLDNGNYPNPKEKCSQFYYMCSNSQALRSDCAAGLYYDADHDMCLAWIHVFACSGQTMPPSTLPPVFTAGTTQKPAFDCSEKGDNDYADPANACSHIYYQCSSGYTHEKKCFGDLFFDVTRDMCDEFDNVFACSGKTPAPEIPTSPPPRPTLASLPMDCSKLDDGNYEDPEKKCSDIFYTCSGSSAWKVTCAPGLFFDKEINQCERFSRVPACSGKPRPVPTAAPVSVEPLSPKPSYPFDCTKLLDGNYPSADCAREYWTCNGGVTIYRECTPNTIYDSEFNKCEFRFLVPKCGGHRLTPAPVLPSTSSEPQLFDCKELRDGNYPDPSATDKCGKAFYSCSNGKAERFECQDGLLYDLTRNLCDFPENVPACGGKSVPNKLTTILMTSTSVVTPSTVKEVSPAAVETTLAPTVPVETTKIATEPPPPPTPAPTLPAEVSTVATEIVPPTPAPTVPVEVATTLPPTVETPAPTAAPVETTAELVTTHGIVTNPVYTGEPNGVVTNPVFTDHPEGVVTNPVFTQEPGLDLGGGIS